MPASSAKTAAIVHAVSADKAYSAFPRERWKGALMLTLKGGVASTIDNGARVRVTLGNGRTFDAVVDEVPSFRAPGTDACVLVRPDGDVLGGQATVAGGTIEVL